MTIQTLNGLLRRVPRWALYLTGALPALWLIAGIMTNSLGADPVARLEHETGIWALRFLVAALAITPLLRFARLNLIPWRRALGVLGFVYACLHLLVWVWLDHWFDWARLGAEIIKRPYITIGMAAFAILLPLAASSNDLALRRLGAATWRRLHWWAYPATLLAALHFLMVVKRWPPEPLVYLGLVTGLLALRLRPRRARHRQPA